MKRLLLLLFVLSGMAWATVPNIAFTVSYTCTGGTGPFAFAFPITDPTAMTVTQNGTLLNSTQYTIVAVNNNYDNGGSVTLNSSCGSGQTLVLTRVTPVTQTVKFYDNMPVPMATFERGLDKLTEIAQELKDVGGLFGGITVGSLPPLFTTTVTDSTSSPIVTFALSNANAGTLFGNLTGGIAAPSFNSFSITGTKCYLFAGSGGAGCDTSSGIGTVTLVSGTTNQIDVATGTSTPVVSLDGQFTSVNYATCTNTADALTVTLSPAPTSLVNGLTVQCKSSGANTTTTPTLNVNSLGAKTIVKGGTSGQQALVANDILTNMVSRYTYDLATTTWELQNPQTGAAGLGTVTSVAMTGDGTIFNASVSGSPITTTGTLAPSLHTQSPNLVLAGPTSGGAVAPTFRSLIAGDLPSTAVTPGSYNGANITVDQQGRITAASSTQPYYGFAFQGAVGASATGLIQAQVNRTVPANFSTPTTVCKCGTNPTSSFALTLKDGASTLGTLTLNSSCALTAATTGGTTQSITAGDQLYLIAPGSADATAANISCNVLVN